MLVVEEMKMTEKWMIPVTRDEWLMRRGLALVEAIRSDKLVGRGTCSTFDECYTDAELIDTFKDEPSITAAVRAARAMEERALGRMMDCRFGDDDDAEVSIMREWRARKREAGPVGKPDHEWRLPKPEKLVPPEGVEPSLSGF